MFGFCLTSCFFHTCLSQLATDTEGSKRTEKEETVNTVNMPVQGHSHGMVTMETSCPEWGWSRDGEVREHRQEHVFFFFFYLCCPFNQVPRLKKNCSKSKSFASVEIERHKQLVKQLAKRKMEADLTTAREWGSKEDKELLQQTFDCDVKIKAATPSE